MSVIVPTSIGRFRRVSGGPNNPDAWLFECPGCGQWAYLTDAQWAGRVSVDHASEGCTGGYHETHHFGAALVSAMQARILTGDKPYDDDDAATPSPSPAQEKEA